jgi:ribosomal protein S18 acetylase RimI-like enzyme
VATNEVAGQVQTFIDEPENEKFNRRLGYTEGISVRRPYRQRGLARAMIAESLRTLKAQGMTESALHVDTESLTGATRLYEACGFATVSSHVVYRKPLGARDV